MAFSKWWLCWKIQIEKNFFECLDEDGHKIFANKLIEHVHSFEIIITHDDFLYIFLLQLFQQ